MSWTLVVLVLYALVLGAITWSSRFAGREHGFVLGGRRVGVIGTTSSQLVSIFDGTGFVILVMLGITIGFSMLWVFAGVSLAYVLLALQAARIRRLAGAGRYLTVSDMLRDRVGRGTATLSAVLLALGLFLSMGASVHVSGMMFGSLLGVPNAVGIAGVCTVVALYLLIGGYQTVIRTDILQWAVLVVFAIYAYSVGRYPEWSVVVDQISSTPPTDMWALPILMFCANYAYADTWQRIFSARDEQTAVVGTLLTAPNGSVIYGSFIVIGASIAYWYPNIPADRFVYESLSNPAISPEIGVIFGTSMLALIMSTLDSRAYTVASTTSSNLLGIDADLEPRRYVRASRILVILMFVVLGVVAVFISDVVAYIINVDSIFGVFAPVFLAALIRPAGTSLARFDRHVSIALLLGTLTWAIMLVGQLYENYFYNLIPVAVSAGFCGIALAVEYFAVMPETEPSNHVQVH